MQENEGFSDAQALIRATLEKWEAISHAEAGK